MPDRAAKAYAERSHTQTIPMEHLGRKRSAVAQSRSFCTVSPSGCYRPVAIFYADRLKVDIRSAVSANQIEMDPRLEPGVAGMAHWSVVLPDHKVIHPRIRLQPGLSALATSAVLVHEVFHILSAMQRLQLDRVLEEGAANLMQYLFLQHQGAPEARALQLALLNDVDPVYGDGFRMARHAYKRCGGFQAFMQFLRSTGGHA